MSFDTVPPWLLAALALLALVFVVMAGAVIALAIGLRGTSGPAKPEVIRALGDFFRSILDAIFRWRPRK
ncbi:hypothetical protein AQJ23_45165 [Streptomyces antibioticus]|nr:hypothetical protein [Streptomyces antibioticus]KUN16469.1 hypothetical protein AQJ23_45165 [Streptomyces antibioticus]